VVAVHRHGRPSFPTEQTPIEYRRKQCRRADNENFRNYVYDVVRSLEAVMIDARMVDFVCPHRGVNLASVPHKRGCVICPAHGLAWSVETGELAKIPTFPSPLSTLPITT
jgi:Rieske [2Fe-2S] domain